MSVPKSSCANFTVSSQLVTAVGHECFAMAPKNTSASPTRTQPVRAQMLAKHSDALTKHSVSQCLPNIDVLLPRMTLFVVAHWHSMFEPYPPYPYLHRRPASCALETVTVTCGEGFASTAAEQWRSSLRSTAVHWMFEGFFAPDVSVSDQKALRISCCYGW